MFWDAAVEGFICEGDYTVYQETQIRLAYFAWFISAAFHKLSSHSYLTEIAQKQSHIWVKTLNLVDHLLTKITLNIK